ncbi:hypothetical protein BYT27DRAFT_7207954 [Phlegmacium glaucopus]|nr:hypothetical protein BYT27DRAFT_7207954 [Phlegmacium glaucopus]
MSTYIATEKQNLEGKELWLKTAKTVITTMDQLMYHMMSHDSQEISTIPTATVAVKCKSQRSWKNIAKKSKLENDNVAKSDESHNSNYKTDSHQSEDSEQLSSNVDNLPSNAEPPVMVRRGIGGPKLQLRKSKMMTCCLEDRHH